MTISRFSGHVDELPAQAICNNVETAGSVTDVDDVVGQHCVSPSGVCGIKGGAKEVVPESLAIGFQFNWVSPYDISKLVETVF
jgi:hypothetical protein